MPDESCRNCGGELEEYLKCKICKKITRYMCRKCARKTLLQYHFLCNVGKEDPLVESIRNNFAVIRIAIAS
jgi:hypothetical protein